jgi:hypothetical protein
MNAKFTIADNKPTKQTLPLARKRGLRWRTLALASDAEHQKQRSGLDGDVLSLDYATDQRQIDLPTPSAHVARNASPLFKMHISCNTGG